MTQPNLKPEGNTADFAPNFPTYVASHLTAPKVEWEDLDTTAKALVAQYGFEQLANHNSPLCQSLRKIGLHYLSAELGRGSAEYTILSIPEDVICGLTRWVKIARKDGESVDTVVVEDLITASDEDIPQAVQKFNQELLDSARNFNRDAPSDIAKPERWYQCRAAIPLPIGIPYGTEPNDFAYSDYTTEIRLDSTLPRDAQEQALDSPIDTRIFQLPIVKSIRNEARHIMAAIMNAQAQLLSHDLIGLAMMSMDNPGKINLSISNINTDPAGHFKIWAYWIPPTDEINPSSGEYDKVRQKIYPVFVLRFAGKMFAVCVDEPQGGFFNSPQGSTSEAGERAKSIVEKFLET